MIYLTPNPEWHGALWAVHRRPGLDWHDMQNHGHVSHSVGQEMVRAGIAFLQDGGPRLTRVLGYPITLNPNNRPFALAGKASSEVCARVFAGLRGRQPPKNPLGDELLKRLL